MNLLRRPVEQKLSALLGLPVTIERIRLSPIRGTLDIYGVNVGTPASPLLTIARVRADIALTRALRREVILRSLTIERPILAIKRHADGTTNLPPRLLRVAAPGADDTDQQGPNATHAAPSWKFEARTILVEDGAMHVRIEAPSDNSTYHASADRITAKLVHGEGGITLTCLIDSIRRRHHAAELGPVKLTAALGNVRSWNELSAATLRAELDAGEAIHLSAATNGAISSNGLEANVSADLSIAQMLAVLPPSLMKWPVFLPAAGMLHTEGKLVFEPAAGIRMRQIEVRISDAPTSARPSAYPSAAPSPINVTVAPWVRDAPPIAARSSEPDLTQR